jgi:uncharacterized protein (TIGR03118 family)
MRGEHFWPPYGKLALESKMSQSNIATGIMANAKEIEMPANYLNPRRASRATLSVALCTLSVMLTPVMGNFANAAESFGDLENEFKNFEMEHRGVYLQHNLVSDGFLQADHTDANLINPWGIVFSPTSPVWVSDQGKGVSTLYDGNGIAFPVGTPLVVTIPKGATAAAATGPTGIAVTTGTANQFVVTAANVSAPSVFLFATLDGLIAGWAPTVNMTMAVKAVDQSAAASSFTGLALANNGTASMLYATDFHNGKVNVFDVNFKPVTLAGTFTDPNIPATFAPYGIHNIGGALWVTFAPKNKVFANGMGFVDVFDANGNLVRRFARGGHLNAPWAVALAPANFGAFSNHILIGNFGSGTILAFDPETGEFDGAVRDANAAPIVIDGLWDLQFGNGLRSQPTNTLFFSAGPGKQLHGLYGRLTAVAKTNGT